jgi:alpha-D-ribose 1-methylphosphonate 5-triphosphate diphosphatase
MWLSDLRIVLPEGILDGGSIQIAEGHIASIIPERAPEPAVHLPGLLALPGLIDIHGDMLEREINPRPNAEIPIDLALHELDKRLVATGITTAYAAVSFAWHKGDSVRSEGRARQIMATVNELRPTLLADHRVHARFEITNPDAGLVLQDLLHRDQVHLISIMDHTPGQGQYRDIEAYVKFMLEWTQRTGENLSEAQLRERVEQAQQRPKGWGAVRAVAELAKLHKIPLASHDDDTVDKVNFVRDLGVTISEFPVTREAAHHAKTLGIHTAMGAPNALRGRSLTGNLSAFDAVADRLVDTLATDYYPAAMMHAAFAFAEKGILPLHESIKLVTQNPADSVGLHDRGRLQVGCAADIVLVEEDRRPRVRGVLRDGVPVYWDRYMAEVGPALRAVNRQ